MSFTRYLYKLKKEIGFSHNFLALIAMIFMFIDHAALMLIRNGKLYGYNSSLYENAILLPEANGWLILYTVMRMIGRISFPIFAFLIVEGFRKAGNLFKYLMRLLLLAIVSEIPYDLMVFNEVFTIRSLAIQNVIFTYIVGLLMLISVRYVHTILPALTILPVALAGMLTHFLKTDYALEGILLMYIFYIFRNDLNLKCVFTIIITILMSYENYHGAAVLSIFFIYFYDGRKGDFDFRQFRYLFYPVHMLVLYFIVLFSNFQK